MDVGTPERTWLLLRLRGTLVAGALAALVCLVLSYPDGVLEALFGFCCGVALMWIAASFPGQQPIKVDRAIDPRHMRRELPVIAVSGIAVGLGTAVGNRIGSPSLELGSIGGGAVSGALVGFVLWEVRKLGSDH